MGNSAPRPTTDQVKAMIKQFTGQSNTLVIPRVFIDFTGDHLAALLLSQILYWSDRTTDPDGWFYKTAEEWHAELGMSTYQVKRAAAALATLGISTKLRKVLGAPRMHYRVDMPQFTDLFLKFLENQETGKSTSLKIKKVENGFSRNSKNMDYEETSKSSIHRLPETTSREGATPAPALDIYAQLTGIRPAQYAATMIAEQVTDTNRWERTIKDWLASGFKPANVKGMLDWYHGKGRHQNNGATNRAPADLPLTHASPQPTPEERAAAAERRRAILDERKAR